MLLSDLLGIKYPLIQGSMARISTHDLVIAVCQAGGLGVLTSVGLSLTDLAHEIDLIQAATDRPFAVNLMLMQDNIPDIVDVVIAKHVPIVMTGAGTPKPYAAQLAAAHIKLIPVIPSVKIAQKMADLGAVAVVAEGMESGGHIGASTTMSLVPQVAAAVDIPVIAGGGIATGAGIAAAMALGASGVQIGTAFIAAEETPVAPVYKAGIVAASDTDTVVTSQSVGDAVRSLKTPLAGVIRAKEQAHASANELQALTRGSLERAIEGDLNTGTFMAGQAAGLVTKVAPVAEIIRRLFAEYDATLDRLAQLPHF